MLLVEYLASDLAELCILAYRICTQNHLFRSILSSFPPIWFLVIYYDCIGSYLPCDPNPSATPLWTLPVTLNQYLEVGIWVEISAISQTTMKKSVSMPENGIVCKTWEMSQDSRIDCSLSKYPGSTAMSLLDLLKQVMCQWRSNNSP